MKGNIADLSAQREERIFKMNTEIRKKIKPQLMRDLEAAACLGMSYVHYKAYQRSLAEKRKARARKEREKKWTKEKR